MIKKTIFTLCLLTCVAHATAIKSWTSGETVRSSDLNANFTHLHNNLGHGHGAVVTNADISSSAAIAHTKMATPALLPKAWGFVSGPCAGAGVDAGCTLADSSGVTAVYTNAATGSYRVNLSYSPPDTSFGVSVTANTPNVFCTASAFAATTGDSNATNFVVKCANPSGGITDGGAPIYTPTDSVFSFIVMDT